MTARIAFPILLFLSFCATAAAQKMQSYFGPTLGISTPDFGRPEETFYYYSGETFTGHGSPIPSPIVGANAGITVRKHLALDAALQYSYTGQHYSLNFAPPQSDYIHKERLLIHKIALPVTVGYAGNIGNTHIRFGAGGTFQYLPAGRAVVDFTSPVNSTPTEVCVKINPFGDAGSYSGRRVQVLPHASLSISPTDRLMISAAYSHGKERVVVIAQQLGLYSSLGRNSAIDLTATYLLRTSRANGKAPENVSDK